MCVWFRVNCGRGGGGRAPPPGRPGVCHRPPPPHVPQAARVHKGVTWIDGVNCVAVPQAKGRAVSIIDAAVAKGAKVVLDGRKQVGRS